MTIVFVGMETSGQLRRRFQAAGYETYSCDRLPSEDGGEEMAYGPGPHGQLPMGRHMVGDVFQTLDHLAANDMQPALAVFHPDCTYLTNSAAWAYMDPDFAKYPGVGYHQRVKPETLVGAERRAASHGPADRSEGAGKSARLNRQHDHAGDADCESLPVRRRRQQSDLPLDAGR